LPQAAGFTYNSVWRPKTRKEYHIYSLTPRRLLCGEEITEFMFRLKSIKTQLILYLACFALFLAAKDKDFNFLFVILIAVIFASAAETLVLRLRTKAFRITESAIITGLIIGFVLSTDETWWKIALASLSAIFFKHLIRIKNRHIFNPAAFGIFLAIIVLGASTGWRGTYFWYILAPFGLYFAHRFRKTEVVAGYAVVSLLLFGIQAFLQKVPFVNIFGYFSYFYIFVMVIEPKTTPVNSTGKYVFGAGAAALIFVLTQAGVKFDAELFSLLSMNAAVPFLNTLSQTKGDLK